MNNVETTQIQPPKLTKIKMENMNRDQVSYKMTLLFKSQENHEKNEVRRFVVPQDRSTSMVYLKEKLRSLFGKQLEDGMKITWRDEDGDEVSIESDEELLIALHEMKGPLYKLSVMACHQDELLKLTGAPKDQEVHPGVICDACDGPVVGHRYKCLKCLDFDLCGKCEAKGFHPGHNMMRIATPETVWPRHFFNRLNKMQTRASKINGLPINEAKNDEIPKWIKVDNIEDFKRLCEVHCGNDEDQIKEFTELRRKTKNREAAMRLREKRIEFTDQIMAENYRLNNLKQSVDDEWNHVMSDQKNIERLVEKKVEEIENFLRMPPTSNHIDLMNIGQAVRAALDPFGVDVDVSIETPAKKPRSERATEMDQAQKEKVDKAREAKENMTSEAKGSSLPKDDATKPMETLETNEVPKIEAKVVETNLENPNPKNLNPDVEMVNVGVKAMEISEKTMPKPVQEETPQIPEESKDTDEDWTVLDQTSPNMSNSASASPEPETPRGSQAAGAAMIYPKLDNSSPDLSGLSPKIKIAVQAMENMGFTNEEGWLSNLLSNLLIKYDGDIGKILDLLALRA